ncbi:MAG: lytic transglycosylase domain-containing protein [Christensenellales bacterium]|jgi:soluble lytic murein transglycosylase
MAFKRKRRRTSGALRLVMTALIAILVIGMIALGYLMLIHSRAAHYPVLYVPQITLAAQENRIPAPYVAAVIMAESSYDPQAVSSVGAMGLMQIMPDTGDWIAGKLGETYDQARMFEPDTSIRYGSWYLGFLMDRYGGDMISATAAYHAGQGTVDNWLRDPALSPDGKTLAGIGYETTATYVKRVLKYYDYYQKAYAADAP